MLQGAHGAYGGGVAHHCGAEHWNDPGDHHGLQLGCISSTPGGLGWVVGWMVGRKGTSELISGRWSDLHVDSICFYGFVSFVFLFALHRAGNRP